MTDLLQIVVIWLLIAATVVIVAGEPDMVDAMRCKVLEIPMPQCKPIDLDE